MIRCFACAWPRHLCKRDGKVLILMEKIRTPGMEEVVSRQLGQRDAVLVTFACFVVVVVFSANHPGKQSCYAFSNQGGN